jgi:hypothetical protein
MLRLIHPDEPVPTEWRRSPSPLPSGWLRLLLVVVGLVGGVALLWWSATADVRALQALPDEQRIPFFRSTVDNLKNICDPAAPRSLRDFCRKQAELAIKFQECERDPACQQLARRHLSQPHR